MRTVVLRSLLGLCLLAPGAVLAQGGAGAVYVSYTDAGKILRVNPATGVPSTVLSLAGARFEDLVMGPDRLLVACDPTNGRIIRIDPDPATNPGASYEVVYQSGGPVALAAPQCGWFGHKGDLYLSSKTAGSGVWRVPGLAGIPLGGVMPDPVKVLGAPALGAGFSGAGLTQNHNGDLLLVDHGGGRLLSSPFQSLFTTVAPLATGLREPVGVARRSNGDLFFTTRDGLFVRRTGGAVSPCLSFSGNLRPNHLAFAADDTLYLAAQSNNSGVLYQVNVATCPATATVLLTLRNPDFPNPSMQGIALPVTSRTITKGPFSGFQPYGFGGHAYFLTASECKATIVATQAAPADLQALIDATGDQGRPIPYLGEGGHGMIYQLAAVSPPGCQPELDGFFRHYIGGYTDPLVNPRIVRCEDAAADCTVLGMEGFYPISTLFPDDAVLGGKGSTFSRYFIGEFSLTGVVTERGQFCGFRDPLLQSPPNPVPSYSAGGALPVKFLLAAATEGASCQSGPYLNQGVLALLSVARILDGNGNPVFEPVRVQPSGSSNPDEPALFRSDTPSKQYIYNLSTSGYLPGTYSLNVLFLTDNEAAQTTVFRIVP